MDNEELYLLMRKCGRYLHQVAGGRLSQKRLLIIIHKRKIVSQRKLMDILDIQAGSLSELLSKVESEGWIERKVSPEDKRIMNVTLTQLGEQKAIEFHRERQVVIDQMFEVLSEEEKETLAKGLSKLLDKWKECDEIKTK